MPGYLAAVSQSSAPPRGRASLPPVAWGVGASGADSAPQRRIASANPPEMQLLRVSVGIPNE